MTNTTARDAILYALLATNGAEITTENMTIQIKVNPDESTDVTITDNTGIETGHGALCDISTLGIFFMGYIVDGFPICISLEWDKIVTVSTLDTGARLFTGAY